jgi:hypothetical protein
LSARVAIIIIDQKQLGLQLAGPVSVTPGHALTQEVADLLAGDVSASITSQLAKALDTSQARASLPDLPGLTANIQNAQFADNGPELLIRTTGMAQMTSDTFNTLLALMTK